MERILVHMASSPEEFPSGPGELHLGKFAKPEADASDDGHTMIIRRSADSTAAKATTDEVAFEQEFGLPFARMLGIVCHCYSRGVFRSDDVAALIRDERSLRDAFGRKLPDGPAVRRFRRRFADQLEDTLETAYRATSEGSESQTTVLQKKAADVVHDAAWTDNRKR